MIKFNGGSWKPHFMLTRISQIVGCGGEFHEQLDGFDYMLGTGNNWWMDFDKEKREYTLTYRHEGLWTQEDKDALKRAICLLLQIKKDNNF